MYFTRRRFLGQAAPLAVAPFLPACEGDLTEFTDGADGSRFQHGVASGDPLADGVLLWTRVSPGPDDEDVIEVEWVVALDPGLNDVVTQGSTATSAGADHTLKVDVTGLTPGTTYYYRFRAFDSESPVGRTRTLPVGPVERATLAVVSCSNYPAGHFHAYRLIAERTDLDFVLHLGDYIYEYGDRQYGDGSSIGRVPDPAHESLSLEDYRRRHAQYKRDPDLQELHRQHPFVVVWDDHEVANDAYAGGAQNHQATEGDYAARKAAALQAYFEWMPIRAAGAGETPRIYRSLPIGDLADLLLLDTRHLARDQSPRDACDVEELVEPSRQLLGEEQEAWLVGELSRSQAAGTAWRLIGQQTMFAQLANPLLGPTCVFNVDQWDGYGASRARLLAALGEGAIDNVVILTGDLHTSWASEIADDPFDAGAYDPATGAGSRAVEFVTPGVSSPGITDPSEAALLLQVLGQTHPHVKFAELTRQGYVLLELDRERARASWFHVGDVRATAVSEELAARFEALSGSARLTPV